MTTDESLGFLALLKNDLRDAMRARNAAEITTLRGLIAAVDNAQAVPVGDRHETYLFHAFGDGAVEVPRKAMGRAELLRLVETEIRSRSDAADDYRRLGRDDKARDLSQEVEILSRYGVPLASG